MSDLLEVHERHERASEAHGHRDAFSGRVSLLVAFLAVITAGTSSLENTETAAAITDSSRAVLAQDRATDQWNLYEAKSLKKNMLDIAAQQTPAKSSDFQKKSAKEAQDQVHAEAQARAFETARDEAIASSERHEARHTRLAIAAALLEIGIAISTIAIITRRHWPWILSAALGTAGALTGISAFL